MTARFSNFMKWASSWDTDEPSVLLNRPIHASDTPAARRAERLGAHNMSNHGRHRRAHMDACTHTSMLSVHPILTSILSDNDLVNEVRHGLDKRLMQLDAYQWVELSVVQ